MKKIILYLALIVHFVSCSNFPNRSPADIPITSHTVLSVNPKVALQIEEFQNLVEEALVWRSKSLQFAEAHAAQFGKKVLGHEEMLQLYESIDQYLILREKILKHAFFYQELVDSFTQIKLNTGKGTFDQTGGSPELKVLFLDPLDEAGRDMLLRMKVSFAASLVLYDNYLLGIYPYQTKRKIRNLLNKDRPGAGSEIEKITLNFFKVENRNKAIRAENLFSHDLALKIEHNIKSDPEEIYLEELIKQSPFFQYLSEKKHAEIDPKGIRAIFDQFYDRVRFTSDSFGFITSKIFGNTLGLVAFRKGKMTKLPEEEKAQITREMEPLDILLEKTPFRLTDKFIPGYYGHVAIWTGDETDLVKLGVWDHPTIIPYHQQIREGRRIVEALRPGVQINSLEHFLNIDDLLVLRDKNLTDDLKKEFIIRAFSQIGKDYDFNFDVETDKKIVCSEIVYTVFHDISWPTKKSLGRYTISPDNVAEKAVTVDGRNAELDPVMMYRAGARETGDLHSKLLLLLGH